MTSLIRVGLFALALSAAGCGGDDGNGPGGGADARPTADAPPPVVATVAVSVAPRSPGGIRADGTLTNGVNITVTVTNFTLTNPFAGDARIANADGHGNYSLYLDTSSAAFTSDYQKSIQLAIPVGTASGSHTFKVTVFQNDGTPVSPALSATSMPFTVQP